MPVPVTQLDTVHRTCDFCGDDHPMWTLRGAGVKVLATGSRTDLLQDMGETWAACVPCTADLDAGMRMSRPGFVGDSQPCEGGSHVSTEEVPGRGS